MKLGRADMKELRLAIGAAAAMIALGIGGVAATDYSLGVARNAREAAKQSRTEALKRVEQVAEEEREIRRNLVFYQTMSGHGMAGEQNRLDLIDAIAKIKKARRLFEIRYEIEPQKRLDYAGIRPAGAMDLVTSRMKLEMLLLHEQDLLAFLGDLKASEKAYISVRGCAVSREGAAASPLAVTPRLRSECQVDLVAVRRANSP